MSNVAPIRKRGQPPLYGRPHFNENSFLGRHCVFAWYPGLAGPVGAAKPSSTLALRPSITALGKYPLRFTHIDDDATPNTTSELGWGEGAFASGIVYKQPNLGTLWREDDAGNIRWSDPQNISLFCLFKTYNVGNHAGDGDPRLISKDVGTSEQDHHYMIGGVRAGVGGENTAPRARFKFGATTLTLVGASRTWQANAMNAMAATYDGAEFALHHIREDGSKTGGERVATAASGDLSIYSGATLGIGASAAVYDNFFEGEIYAILAFDRAFDNTDIWRSLMQDWTQIFEPTWVIIGEPTAGGIQPPNGLTATVISDTEVDLSWSPVVEAEEYDLEREESDGGGGWTNRVVFTSIVGTTYSDTGLTPGQTYRYRVRSVDTN